MARTLSGKSPERQAREQEIIIVREAQKFERRFAYEVARAMRSFYRAMNSGESLKLERAKYEHRKKVERLLIPLYKATGESIQATIEDTKKSFGISLEKKAVDVEGTPTADKIMADWLRLYGGVKISQITNTTLEDVRTLVRDGISQGLSERQIGKLVFSVAPTKSASRAQTIARTEAHQAANVTAAATAKASGLTLKKRWVSSKGERTRIAHREADGQTVAQDQPFIVDGEQLMFPGDPAGSAGNVINCRCMVVYVLA